MWQTKFGQLLLFLFSSGILGFSSSSLTQAQVVPDRSLNDESSLVTNDVMVKEALADLIEGGAIRDRNLFHSFIELSINNGDRVYFANPESITNIITRVTGNNISELFGTLGVDGAANLWLLNPNGIVFGSNATLDVNGSFLATTADSYIFNNGFAYSATNPETPPLLTINIPLGLQFGETAEPIINQSIAPDPLSESPRGLQVPTQETIAFVGGELKITGGRISAPQGNIELGSVAENSFVSIEPTPQGWKLDYQETSSFQDINLTDEARIEAIGNGAGNIRLQGKNIRLQNGSDILNITLGTESGGQISLVASDNIELTSLDSEEGGNINASLSTRATGKGADITIKARNLFLQDESVISTGTIGAGDAGNVTIETDRLLMGSGAGIIAIAFSAGDAGNITIKTDRLLLRENAEINTSIFSVSGLGDVVDAPGVGDAGDILIQASDIELMNSARISSSTNQDSIGNAGNLTIETDRLALRDSSLIDAGTFSAGDGSDLLIQASEIVIDDSLILTSAELGATGNAGDLTIETNNLSLQNGGRITSETFGMGNAGDVMIRASESLTIDGTVKISSPENEPRVFFSGIFANAQPDTIGNSGSVKIETNELQITNDGQISVSNLGSGNSGDLYITANQLNLDSDATIEAIVNVGDRGNINLTTNNIFLRNNNQITAQAIGTATGGNIMINNRDNLVLQNNSQIIADAIQGNGGNITITTQGLFVDFDSSISASSQFGLDGNIRIDILNGDRLIELTALPINPIDATQQVTSGCGVGNDFALSGKGGLPENPTQTLRNQTVWQDTRLINRDATDNQGANSNIKRKLLPQTPILEAQAWKVNHRGKIELFATTANSHFFPNFSNCAPNPE